ncbi:DgyrCDS6665 [Dimorphilus gyrociliatus]|uniref:DgyrCDS6665 n=1 Tax=Dimorphilus gyrociliatus TaxID=2664684 RepID=A0A7I8VNQ6_9ANNE|nr:DgyrCDS6665 [Dimorphilus gyrociliatus]
MKRSESKLANLLKLALVFNITLFIFSVGRYVGIKTNIEPDPPKIPAIRPVHHTYKIPNIIHYVWYNEKEKELKFHHLLSMLSSFRIQNPEKIIFHTNKEPVGKYWNEAKRQITSLNINYRQPPLKLFGEDVKKPLYYTSHSNVDRVKIVHEYGGIYLDLDTVVLSPMEPLRNYSCVIGQEQSDKSCGCVFMCEKNAPFLSLWLNSYLDDYRIEEWAYNSGKVPWKLARRYPQLVFVEKNRLLKPNFKHLDQLYGKVIVDWTKSITMHLWYRLAKQWNFLKEDPNEENIKLMDTTFGQIARYIYFDNSTRNR